MKTFIWNTGYEVYISVAENLEQAKIKLYLEFVTQSIHKLIEEKDKNLIKENKLPSYVLYRAESIIRNSTYSLLEIWNKEPDYILEQNQAIIYDHSNE